MIGTERLDVRAMPLAIASAADRISMAERRIDSSWPEILEAGECDEQGAACIAAERLANCLNGTRLMSHRTRIDAAVDLVVS